MKRVILVLMFLMLAGGVLAMTDPIIVKSTHGKEIKIYVWPSETGQILNSKSEIADENGSFETTFFSLNVPTFKLHVMVINSEGKKIRDSKFLGMDTNGSIFIDCLLSDCEIVEEVEEVVVENESIVENETVTDNESVVVEESWSFVSTGKAIFLKSDGSVNWGYFVGGFVMLVVLIVFIIGMMHNGKVKRGEVMRKDEKEFSYMEKKVRETADKIKSVKDGKVRKVKIEEAKAKLVEEEAELKDLEEGGNDDKIESSKDDSGDPNQE